MEIYSIFRYCCLREKLTESSKNSIKWILCYKNVKFEIVVSQIVLIIKQI